MRYILAVIGLCLAGPALADTDCDNAQDQATMTHCAAQEAKTADAELNKDYKEIVARLADDTAGLQKLKAAQRAWVAFRDAECAFQESGVDGGSVAPMINQNCITSLTEDRIAQLQTYLQCEEGDLSCPVPPAN